MNTRNWTPAIIEIGDQLAALTSVKARELMLYLEQVHGIESASLPVVAPDVIHDDDAIIEPAQPTEFAVRLDRMDPARRIVLIKLVRERLGLGLKEARDLLEGLPKIIKGGLSKEDAEALQNELQTCGAVTVLV